MGYFFIDLLLPLNQVVGSSKGENGCKISIAIHNESRGNQSIRNSACNKGAEISLEERSRNHEFHEAMNFARPQS